VAHAQRTELLASWRDTATRSAIVDFVAAVSDEDGPGFVAPEERIAVFDNDGTLWSEKPTQIQLFFTLTRLAELAKQRPELATQQPYRSAVDGDLRWLGETMIKHYNGDDTDLGLLKAAVESAFETMLVEDYALAAREWFQNNEHPVLKRPYLSCGFAPMVELLRYLEANGFTTYIASGGDRDFMRPVAGEMYGIPPERVIGSTLGLHLDEQSAVVDLLYKSEMEFFDDGPEKPIRIWSRIGRRPLVAGGNSNGDIPMLRFARAANRDGLRLLVLHDDAEREFDYTAGAEQALARAKQRNWTVVSMKDDWSRIFAD
jgi:phosphoserine phosphatase